MLQLRATLPANFENEEGLTQEGRETMLVLTALLERYGIEDFQILRSSK